MVAFLLTYAPLLAAFGSFLTPLVLWLLNRADTHLDAAIDQIENPKLRKLVAGAENLLFDSVKFAFQTFVTVQEKHGTWNDAAKQEARDIALRKWKELLGSDGLDAFAVKVGYSGSDDPGFKTYQRVLLEKQIDRSKGEHAASVEAQILAAHLNAKVITPEQKQ